MRIPGFPFAIANWAEVEATTLLCLEVIFILSSGGAEPKSYVPE
jgi:hypothetical protein